MRILVTGGTGFIGSYTALALQQAGHQPRLLVRSPDKLARLMTRHGAQFDDVVSGDVTDAEAVAAALEGCDGVVHTAAFVSTNKRDEERVFATNVGGTRNVIGQAAAMGLRHIVHVSSTTAIYNPEAASLTGAEDPADSDSPYGKSKAACERYVRELQAQGKPVSISYPAAVIGPKDPALTEPHEGLLIFLKRLGVVTSSGLQMVDVRDVARAHVAMIEQLTSPERITLGGHYYPWQELIDTLEEITGRRLRKAPIPGPLLRLLGKGGDLAMRLGAGSTPINTEATTYATRWVCTDDVKFRELLGLAYRDYRETMRDTLYSLFESGHLSAQQIGRLAEAAAEAEHA